MKEEEHRLKTATSCGEHRCQHILCKWRWHYSFVYLYSCRSLALHNTKLFVLLRPP